MICEDDFIDVVRTDKTDYYALNERDFIPRSNRVIVFMFKHGTDELTGRMAISDLETYEWWKQKR